MDNYDPVTPSSAKAKHHDELPSVKKELINEALSWAKTIFFALAFAVLINTFVIVNATVPTGSMMNTIQPNDRIIAFRLAYRFSQPQRYDIVVFRSPDDSNDLYVKRIVGLPGDTIVGIDGHVYVNGEDTPLRSDFVRGELEGSFGPYMVPQDHFFVLGDYRGNSHDSRRFNDTFVCRDLFLGRVVFRYFPGFKNLRRT